MKKFLIIFLCLLLILFGFFIFKKKMSPLVIQPEIILTITPTGQTFKLGPKTKPTTIPKNENDFYSQIGENIKELFK